MNIKQVTNKTIGNIESNYGKLKFSKGNYPKKIGYSCEQNGLNKPIYIKFNGKEEQEIYVGNKFYDGYNNIYEIQVENLDISDTSNTIEYLEIEYIKAPVDVNFVLDYVI